MPEPQGPFAIRAVLCPPGQHKIAKRTAMLDDKAVYAIAQCTVCLRTSDQLILEQPETAEAFAAWLVANGQRPA